MERFLPWVTAAITGLALVWLLNLSPLAQHNIGVRLPAGWSVAGGQTNCTAAMLNDCTYCVIQPGEGLPFAFSRQDARTCDVESNNLALLADALVGAGLGALGMAYMFQADNRRHTKN